MTIKEILSKFYQVNIDLYRTLKEQSQLHRRVRDVDVSELYEKVHREAAPCFVLSTGRCGTKLLTNLLRQNDRVETQHVPTPEFTYYGQFAYENAHSNPELVSKIVDSGRYELIRDAYLLGKTYVETNNRITFFCHALAEIFPKATFIHLVRRPEEFITSGLARNWYSGSVLHDEGRIKPQNEQLEQPEKIAWLWNETNAFIEEFKERQSPERVLTVKSEELFESPEATIKIFEFLQLEAPGKSTVRQMISKPVNKQNKDHVAEDTVTDELLDKMTPLRSHYFG